MSADTEDLEVFSARQKAVTSGQTHVQEVSSTEHQVLKEVVSYGETHVLATVSTSLPATLEEDSIDIEDLVSLDVVCEYEMVMKQKKKKLSR
ncbi:hypothetical protein Tco_0404865 [Tanacetum coccineum]